jgi:hypothetical protein
MQATRANAERLALWERAKPFLLAAMQQSTVAMALVMAQWRRAIPIPMIAV